MAALLSEAEPGVVRINLRGEEGTPVLPLAAQLGGGGHPYSAGVRMRGPLTEVVERFLGHATEYLHPRSGEHGKGATP
jgi:nanoRNase/pAp phosphatase (c-di-AMP/oligoRNAs hydrolase)